MGSGPSIDSKVSADKRRVVVVGGGYAGMLVGIG